MKSVFLIVLLICHLNHGMPYDAAPVQITLLKLLSHHILSQILVFHVKHRIVEIGIKRLSLGLDRFYSRLLQVLQKLLINHLHALGKGTSLGILRHRV